MCLVGVRAKDQSVKCQNFEGFQKLGGVHLIFQKNINGLFEARKPKFKAFTRKSFHPIKKKEETIPRFKFKVRN